MLWYAIGLIGIFVIVQNWRLSSRRSRSMAILGERADIDLEQEWGRLVQGDTHEFDEIRRIWLALAAEYGIPPAKIRSEDCIQGELAGVLSHPDHDPFLTSLFLSNRKIVHRHLSGIKTWGELVTAIRVIELETGRPATTTMQAGQECVWAD